MRVLSGIAACLALIVGTILFYYSNNNTMQTKEKIVDREILAENIQPKIAENSYSKEEPSDEGSGEEIAENQKNLMMDLTFQKILHLTLRKRRLQILKHI